MALLCRQNAVAKATTLRSAPIVRRRCTTIRSAAPNSAAASSASVMVETATAVHTLTSESYDTFIASNDIVLVDYYTDWCGPCKMIAPHLEVMAQEMPHVKFGKLNCTTDAAAKKIAMAQGIKALPTFHMFKGGNKIGAFVGGKPQQLKKFVEENAGSA